MFSPKKVASHVLKTMKKDQIALAHGAGIARLTLKSPDITLGGKVRGYFRSSSSNGLGGGGDAAPTSTSPGQRLVKKVGSPYVESGMGTGREKWQNWLEDLARATSVRVGTMCVLALGSVRM